jgi:multidrug efflux pump subunit AcrA (membrane-fusion protein)
MMKPTHIPISCLAAAALVMMAGCSPQKSESPPEEQANSAQDLRVTRGSSGEVTVALKSSTQQAMGLETAELKPVTVSPEVKGYGRVLHSTPLAKLALEVISAATAARAAQAELDRLRTLSAQNNASQRALQTAEVAAIQAQAQAQTARLELLGSWGKTVAERQDLADWVASLAALKQVLVQIDVPPASATPAEPVLARLEILSGRLSTIEAEFLGRVPNTDPQLQSPSFLYLVNNGGSRLLPGMAVTGFLSVAGEPQAGVLVPASAIVRSAGTAWVYVQVSPTEFERVSVELERLLEGGWFVAGRLKAGQRVVSVGAQEMLSAERTGANED